MPISKLNVNCLCMKLLYCLSEVKIFLLQVYRGTYDDVPVAVKVFRRPYKQDILLQQYKDLREELTIMSHLDHPRVVSLVGVVLRPLCMVIQLAPQSSLNDHLDLCPHGLHHNIAHRVLYQVKEVTHSLTPNLSAVQKVGGAGTYSHIMM